MKRKRSDRRYGNRGGEVIELNHDPDTAVERLAEIPEHVVLFAAAVPEDPRVTLDNLAAAIAAFERTFVSDRSIYDAYLRGHLGTFDRFIGDALRDESRASERPRSVPSGLQVPLDGQQFPFL